VAPKKRELTATESRLLALRSRNPEAHIQELAAAAGISRRQASKLVNRDPLRSIIRASYSEAVNAALLIAKVNLPKAIRRLLKIIDSEQSDDRDVIAAVREIRAHVAAASERDGAEGGAEDREQNVSKVLVLDLSRASPETKARYGIN
jgi:hypothetical protein